MKKTTDNKKPSANKPAGINSKNKKEVEPEIE